MIALALVVVAAFTYNSDPHEAFLWLCVAVFWHIIFHPES